MILMQTNHGPIKIQLDHENTPKTAENFAHYAEEGFYDGTIFHRVIDGFMIQGGGFEPGMEEKDTDGPIENEANRAQPNKRGSVAMARTSDPHSASAQFFINTKDNDFLDFRSEDVHGWGYCVFGHVTEGMDVVDKITGIATESKQGHQDVPVEDVVIEKITIEEE
ncbi:MAG: peptidyl-prolyl cis-trans isomerase [Gammaproteobacteria bacterium]|nr:peptidyl-prolyl cis-trans isomerase [Gammaproteobacteria bacterium]